MANSKNPCSDEPLTSSDDLGLTSLPFLHSISEPVIVLNADREIVVLNDKAQEHFEQLGFKTPGEAIGDRYPEVLERNLLELSERKLRPLTEAIRTLSPDREAEESIRIPDQDSDLHVKMRSFTYDSTTYTTVIHLSRDLNKRILKDNRRRLSLALNAARAGVWDWNLKTDEEYWDRNTEELFGLEPGEFDGTYEEFAKFVHDEDLPALEQAARDAIDQCGGFEKEFRIRTADGRKRWLLSRGEVYTDSKGNPETMIGVTMDVTDKKNTEKALEKALEEKETLMAEIHHRVKNNLQMINSLLNMQSRNFQSEKVNEILQDSRARVRALAIIHENLYQSSDVEKINIREYLGDLVDNLLITFNAREAVSCEMTVEDWSLDLDRGIACGLIVNELVTNSLEHGLDLSEGGKITIGFERTNADSYTLTVEDDGSGFAPDFELSESQSTGFDIVQSLAEFELDGSVEISNSNGAKVKVEI